MPATNNSTTSTQGPSKRAESYLCYTFVRNGKEAKSAYPLEPWHSIAVERSDFATVLVSEADNTPRFQQGGPDDETPDTLIDAARMTNENDASGTRDLLPKTMAWSLITGDKEISIAMPREGRFVAIAGRDGTVVYQINDEEVTVTCDDPRVSRNYGEDDNVSRGEMDAKTTGTELGQK